MEDEKKTYSADELRLLSDPIPTIQRMPRMYIGADKATGEALADQMIGMLIRLGILPAKISRLGPWWLISSDVDWLTRDGEPDVGAAFSRLLPLQGYPNHHRSEILLSAVADAVVTSGTDGTKWVSGDASLLAPPDSMERAHPPGGRTVAFRLEGAADN